MGATTAGVGVAEVVVSVFALGFGLVLVVFVAVLVFAVTFLTDFLVLDLDMVCVVLRKGYLVTSARLLARDERVARYAAGENRVNC